eukprot:766463-Pyramimonas_sp.AAC.1
MCQWSRPDEFHEALALKVTQQYREKGSGVRADPDLSEQLGLVWASSRGRMVLTSVIDEAGEAIADPDERAACLARHWGEVARHRHQRPEVVEQYG